MQLIMWPSFVTVLLTVRTLCAAASVQQETHSRMMFTLGARSSSAGRQWEAPAPAPAPTGHLAGTDDQEEHERQERSGDMDDINKAFSPDSACSCDCCSVAKMSPLRFRTIETGEQITSECQKAVVAPGTEQANDDAVCPNMCQIPLSNAVLKSVQGEVDYNRFCRYNCQPFTDSPGTSCVQFDKEHYELAQKDDTGNGKEVYIVPVLGIGSGYGSGPKGGAKKAGADDEEEAVAKKAAGPKESAGGGGDNAGEKKAADDKKKKAKGPPVEIVYDMRKLIAERLRAEAGAAVAAAANSAERVRINKWQAKENLKSLKKRRVRIGAQAGKVEAGIADVQAQKNVAVEAEQTAKKDLALARQLARDLPKNTKKLADEAIKKAVEPCAAQVAKARAQAKGLDKPEDWVKVVAARAANPYMQAVTAAVSRTAEYKAHADGLMGQAYGLQQKANALITHVNVLQAHGDTLGAIIEKKQVTNLLARARGLEAEAKGYQNTADNTRLTVPKWQNAAAQAAAYAAWEYSNNALAYR